MSLKVLLRPINVGMRNTKFLVYLRTSPPQAFLVLTKDLVKALTCGPRFIPYRPGLKRPLALGGAT